MSSAITGASPQTRPQPFRRYLCSCRLAQPIMADHAAGGSRASQTLMIFHRQMENLNKPHQKSGSFGQLPPQLGMRFDLEPSRDLFGGGEESYCRRGGVANPYSSYRPQFPERSPFLNPSWRNHAAGGSQVSQPHLAFPRADGAATQRDTLELGTRRYLFALKY